MPGPASSAAFAHGPRSRMTSPARRPGATILVVDDDESVRVALRAILETDGYAVDEVASGQAALRACQQGGPALIVTDLVMPDCDGLELLRTLRREHPDVPVIVVTGTEVLPQGALADIASRLGARQVFLKPMPVAAFRQAVRDLVARP